MENQVQNQKNQKPNRKNLEVSGLSEQYSGPIPHPSTMEGYARLDPSFPDRILKLTEDNLNHQYKHENKMDNLQFLGWFSATIITLATLGCGTYLLLNDKDLAGFSCLVGSALPSILIFFKTRNNKSN